MFGIVIDVPKHLRALFGFSSSKWIFCHYTNTGGGVKIIPKPLPVPSIMFLSVTDEGLIMYNKGIGDAGSTADLRMLWSAIVCLGLGLL